MTSNEHGILQIVPEDKREDGVTVAKRWKMKRTDRGEGRKRLVVVMKICGVSHADTNTRCRKKETERHPSLGVPPLTPKELVQSISTYLYAIRQ